MFTHVRDIKVKGGREEVGENASKTARSYISTYVDILGALIELDSLKCQMSQSIGTNLTISST